MLIGNVMRKDYSNVEYKRQKAHLYKQCGLNQHCRQVDCDDCLEDEADELGRNNDDQGVVMRFMLLKTMPRRRRP